jgi:hypothetical protein
LTSYEAGVDATLLEFGKSSWVYRAMFDVDRSAFSIASLENESDERAYWQSKTPYERLQAIEMTRQVIYGYEPSTTRLQRFFEVVELKRG